MDLRERFQKLLSIGYSESTKKKYLMYKLVRREREGQKLELVMYADMRVDWWWGRTVPVCYIQNGRDSKTAAPDWLINRAERECLQELHSNGIPFERYAGLGGEDDGEKETYASYLELVEDGYCKHCHRDFQADGRVCPQCQDDLNREEAVNAVQKELPNLPECLICGVKLSRDPWLTSLAKRYGLAEIRQLIPHHTDRVLNIERPVCRPCHARIELGSDPEITKYRAKDRRPPRKPKNKLVPCSGCLNTARVPIDYPGDKEAYCSRCNREPRPRETRDVFCSRCGATTRIPIGRENASHILCYRCRNRPVGKRHAGEEGARYDSRAALRDKFGLQ